MALVLIQSSQFPSLIKTLLHVPTKYFYAADWAGRDIRRTAVGGYEGVAGTCVTSELCVCPSENDNKLLEIEYTESTGTCFRAFLLCFCEGEMSLLVGTEGDEHRGCGEDGCDCSLEGTMKYKRTKQMLKNPLPEDGVQSLSHHAFVLMKPKPSQCTKKQIMLPH